MQNKNFTFKDFIPYKLLYQIFYLFLVACFILAAKYFYENELAQYKQNLYMKIASNINDKIELLLKTKLDRVNLTGVTLANSQNIKDALIERNPSLIHIDSLLKQLKMEKNLSDCCVLVKDKYGKTFAHIGKFSPSLKTTADISGFKATKFGFAFYNISHIEYDDKKIGSIVTKSNFDNFITLIRKSGFDSVVLLNKENSAQIDIDQSRTKKFVGQYYVANENSDPYLLKLIKQHGVTDYFNAWEKPYNDSFSSEYLIVKYPIVQEGKNIANILLFKKYLSIDSSFEQKIFYKYIAFTLAAVTLSLFIIYFFTIKNIVKKLDRDNKILNLENEKLKEKSDQLDYNEKKLENLFNMQPNLMFMHNGYEITSANKRFMGFFNRFGDFRGFKQNHRCVSELFEKYEAPNYISEQYIEGEFWIDYLLNNPKRLYKTVMSINGKPHHFIIKFNELKYAKYVSERLIIVALVDMTQDLANYKTIDELNKGPNQK